MMPMTTSQAELNKVQFPFPLEGKALYCGEKICKTFDFSYTAFCEGMKKTFDVYKKSHGL